MFDILREEGLYVGPTPPEERILGCLGMLLADIWKNVMPEADEAVHRRADELLLQLEIEGLEAGGTLLYPQVVETLTALKERGVKLFVASNGLEDYILASLWCMSLRRCSKACIVREVKALRLRPSCYVFFWIIMVSAVPGWLGIVLLMFRQVKEMARP